METNPKTKSLKPKTNLIKDHHRAASLHKEKTTSNVIIITVGILFSSILFLVKIRWNNIDRKIILIPLMVAIQIILLISALKNRYKKL